jgi:hypothetical protein
MKAILVFAVFDVLVGVAYFLFWVRYHFRKVFRRESWIIIKN